VAGFCDDLVELINTNISLEIELIHTVVGDNNRPDLSSERASHIDKTVISQK
jgi:hypothetical protein